MSYLLSELKPLTISKTSIKNKTKSREGETYISLAQDDNSYTVYTTEKTEEYKDGFVMTLKTKKLRVDVLYEPEGNPETLLDYSYPQEYEVLKQKALDWLEKNEEKVRKNDRKQVLDIILKLNEAKANQSRFKLSSDDIEQEEIIFKLKNQNKTRQEIINELKNLKPTDPEVITINHTSFKRDNKTIAQIKILRNFKCQICSTSIKKKNGTFYIEAAHIDPKHNMGCETPDNIILLCPNHHKEFDFGDRKILQHNKENVIFNLNGQEYKISLKIE